MNDILIVMNVAFWQAVTALITSHGHQQLSYDFTKNLRHTYENHFSGPENCTSCRCCQCRIAYNEV